MLLAHTRGITRSPMYQHYCLKMFRAEYLSAGGPFTPKALWYWNSAKPIMQGELNMFPRQRVRA